MNSTKKTSGPIPIKTVKLANKKFCKDLPNCINECIKQNKFPNELKIADVTPIFKKEDPLPKTSYRLISILPTVSKILKEYYSINYNVFQINFFRLCSVVSGKGTVLNMHFSKNGKSVLMPVMEFLEHC